MQPVEILDVIIVGSGPGGAVTAYELAKAGLRVAIIEEGDYVQENSTLDHLALTIKNLYRKKGMTPIEGSVPIGYVEGCCVGGSSEINSGFWHRTPPDILLGWQAQYGLQSATSEELAPHFDWIENATQINHYPFPLPPNSQILKRGAEKMDWSFQETPRAAVYPENDPKHLGVKQSMSKTIIPMAIKEGAKIIPKCRVRVLLKNGSRITGVVAELKNNDGSSDLIRIDAKHVFICAGPTETPSLLRKNNIKSHVGDTFYTHPMLKVAAKFDEKINGDKTLLSLIQVKEFWPEITLGGAFFSKGLLAAQLSNSGPLNQNLMEHKDNMATFYLAVRGTGQGYVRPSYLKSGSTSVHYTLSSEDIKNLSTGLGRLSTLLLEAGAKAVYPDVFGIPEITDELQAIRWLDEIVPPKSLSLTAVHAFSTCPIGENKAKCAADSWGKVFFFDNLYINDASILPSSPGVNPQGTIMAFARRNAIHFLEINL